MAKKKRSTKRNSNKRPQAPSPAPGKGPVLPLLFTLAAGFACIWAWYLIGVHYEVQAKHETGGLIEATTTEGGGETAASMFARWCRTSSRTRIHGPSRGGRARPPHR